MIWNYNLLIKRDINEIYNIALDKPIGFSTSENNLFLKFSHPKLLAACQRFFCGINPLVDSSRFGDTILYSDENRGAAGVVNS